MAIYRVMAKWKIWLSDLSFRVKWADVSAAPGTRPEANLLTEWTTTLLVTINVGA